MSDICKRCNGTGRMEKCLRCGREYRHIHKYSDCDGPDCDGESAKTIPCSDCAGTGKKAELAADLLSDAVIAEGVRLAMFLTEKSDRMVGMLNDREEEFLDYAEMHCAAALRELQTLRAVIAEFLDADGHDLCHENRLKLAHAIGRESPGYPQLPEEQEFALRCIQYRQNVYGPDGPGSETEVFEQEIACLRAEVARLKQEIAQHHPREEIS